MTRKDTNLPERQATRWWSAPMRFPVATLALLRRAALRRELPPDHPWVRQAPNKIRA